MPGYNVLNQVDKENESFGTSLLDRNEQTNRLQTRPGERCLIRVPAADTNGAYSFVEIVSEQGDGTPLHFHQHEDEYLFCPGSDSVLRGRRKIFDAGAGKMVTLRKNILTPGA